MTSVQRIRKLPANMFILGFLLCLVFALNWAGKRHANTTPHHTLLQPSPPATQTCCELFWFPKCALWLNRLCITTFQIPSLRLFCVCCIFPSSSVLSSLSSPSSFPPPSPPHPLPAINPPHSIFQRGGKVLIRWEVMLRRRGKEESFVKWDLLPAISHNRKGNEAADNSCHSLLDNLGMIRRCMHAEAHRASPARLKAKRRKGLSAESALGTAAA